ncbi:MAG: hypothetical protein WCQ21_14600 [Verrucomicrobiota bacterium]
MRIAGGPGGGVSGGWCLWCRNVKASEASKRLWAASATSGSDAVMDVAGVTRRSGWATLLP